MTNGTDHDGETLAQAIDRLGDDMEDPFDKHRKSRGRTGWADFFHAVMNVPVTWAREQPWLAAHVGVYAAVGAALVIAVLIVVIVWAYGP